MIETSFLTDSGWQTDFAPHRASLLFNNFFLWRYVRISIYLIILHPLIEHVAYPGIRLDAIRSGLMLLMRVENPLIASNCRELLDILALISANVVYSDGSGFSIPNGYLTPSLPLVGATRNQALGHA